MIKHVVLYLFLLSCTCLVQAQDFNIRGTVFEEETGMGLMGAAVLIEGKFWRKKDQNVADNFKVTVAR